jgi:hypothetical protein
MGALAKPCSFQLSYTDLQQRQKASGAAFHSRFRWPFSSSFSYNSEIVWKVQVFFQRICVYLKGIYTLYSFILTLDFIFGVRDSDTIMSNEPKRDRSPNCPKQTLAEAIELARKLHSKGGKAKLQPLVAASTLGYGSLNGAALTAIGTLNQYGLLDKDQNGGLSVSSDAIAVLHPKDESQKLEIMRRMAVNPKVFWELYSGGFHKCDHSVLSNHLIQNGFKEEIAKKVATVFKENTELSKLDDERINALEMTKQKEQSAGKTIFGEIGAHMASSHPGLFPSFSSRPEEPKPGELAVPIGNGKVARVPFPMSKEDFDLFINTLKLWERKLVQPPDVFTTLFRPAPTSMFPARATWNSKGIAKVVQIVAEMGEKDGVKYYKSEDGTGIPATELSFQN